MYCDLKFSLQANRLFLIILIIALGLSDSVNGWNDKYTLVDDISTSDSNRPLIVFLKHERHRRMATDVVANASTLSHIQPTSSSAVYNVTASINATTDAVTSSPYPATSTGAIITTNVDSNSKPTSTPVPLLGRNGTGQYHGNASNSTPKDSDAIVTDDNFSSVFVETPEKIKAEHNISTLINDTHIYYNSSFVDDENQFKEHWKNITSPKATIHELLSNSHRRATTIKLKFSFPFYGHPLPNITVATGGFIYTGEHVHNWLAATQYIAPLMANFDSSISPNSFVSLYDDGEKFTALWENVTLQEDPTKKFTFAVTLFKNGDITFAYKDIPIPIQNISDIEHPVKVGISDAYLTDKIIFYVRRKTIFEYHRVSFKSYEIKNSTLLKLIAQPTCQQLNSCDTCLNNQIGFKCFWCEQIKRCSSGTDRSKQNWVLRNCDKLQISNSSLCPATNVPVAGDDLGKNKTSYITDSKTPGKDETIINPKPLEADKSAETVVQKSMMPVSVPHVNPDTQTSRSPIGGVVAAFFLVILISSVAAWALYAFKNPHTRSGQMLIKYRPSQWSWRRGEARYTAATIHM